MNNVQAKSKKTFTDNGSNDCRIETEIKAFEKKISCI